jgi:hypothetical protein
VRRYALVFPLVLTLALAVTSAAGETPAPRHRILVELFTSQG